MQALYLVEQGRFGVSKRTANSIISEALTNKVTRGKNMRSPVRCVEYSRWESGM